MKTKKRLVLVSLFAIVGMIILAQTAMAGYTVTTAGGGGYGPYQTGQGGEFSLEPNTGVGGLSWILGNYSASAKTLDGRAFQSFCLEEGEYIYGNTTHDATLGMAAINGGKAGGNPDPVSTGTAKLYYEFAKGILAGYKYGVVQADGTLSADDTAARKISADALQRAIWWLEGEADDPGDGNIFRKYIIGTLGTVAAKENNAQFSLYPVMALNLTLNGAQAQSQLAVVPIPGAVWLLGAGLIGLAGIRRRGSELG